MPSHWGHKDLNIVSASSPDGHPVPAGGGLRRSVAALRRMQIAGPRAAIDLTATKSCSAPPATAPPVEGEFWEALNSACNLKLPVVFLVEDNGYAISVPVEVNTAGGSISKLVAGPSPICYIEEVDGCDPRRLVRGDEPGGRLLPRQRKGPALVHAKVIRPYSHSLSDDEVHLSAPPKSATRDAARDPLVTLPALAAGAGHRDRSGTGRDSSRRWTRRCSVAADVALASPQPAHPARSTITSIRRTSTRRPSSSTPRMIRSFSGDPTTMVDLLNACLKDEMTRDPRIVVFGEDVADASREDRTRRGEGEGRRLQGHLGTAEAVRRRPGLQLAARRGEHRRARHRAGDARDEAGGRDPVLRLHLAGVHAAARRTRLDALALQQRLRCAGGRPRHVRRLPQGRRRSITRRPARRCSPASRGCG